MPDIPAQSQVDGVENISSHERVLMILKVLAQFGRPVNAAELMKATGLAKSTLYRQLVMLKRWGFVFESGNLYAPGPVSLQLSLGFNAVSMLTQYARPEMQWLSDLSRETVAITVAVNAQAVCVDMIEAPQSLRCSFEKGRSLPLRDGATAKCLLAHLPELDRKHILQAEFPDAAEKNDRQAQLEDIRTQGYACSHGEVDDGVWGISVPLFASGRFLLGVLSLMAPLQRVADRQPQLISLTTEAAERINNHLQIG
ncbi:IclR family transcriptional regulator [Acerihabitans arboris]|uniref:HTH-type transcriptional repressor AllR n=1 Tax=Acerihabitans arboris TaxID=2691583 RepID=A0A845SMX8_9GAMM|nr:IclR family transcriptional regulator [Acerihabitans arboris]NDL64752.1 helix-turn-helix domain-containing protein [Acerihabitans arboris]